MYYTIYKITNILNQKTYIGMHKTSNLNDGYMGSGKLIRRAIKKYGLDYFVKEILHVFDNEDDMKAKEKELVVLGKNSYNLCPGGHGGFGYINQNKIGQDKRSEWGKLGAKRLIEKLSSKPKKEKTAYDRSFHSMGNKNPNFGKKWITNGETTIQVDRNTKIPDGFYAGKRMRPRCAKCNAFIGKKKEFCSKHYPRKLGIKQTVGTIWINNGILDKRIKNIFEIPDGFVRGRLKGGGRVINL